MLEGVNNAISPADPGSAVTYQTSDGDLANVGLVSSGTPDTSGPLDPRIRVDRKGHNSRAIIDATRPWEGRKQFPAVASSSPD